VLELKPSSLAVGIDVVPQGTSARGDRPREQVAHGEHELLHGYVLQSVGLSAWMKATRKQEFIDVDIAQAGDHRLIKKSGLEAARGAAQVFMERARLDRQGIISEVTPSRRHEARPIRETPDPAETTRIMKGDEATIVEVPDDMGVLLIRTWSRRRTIRQRPGHAEVDAQHRRAFVIAHDGKLLATTIEQPDHSALEHGRPHGSGRAWPRGSELHHVWPTDVHPHDPSAHDVEGE
jgi:hypothetical protein